MTLQKKSAKVLRSFMIILITMAIFALVVSLVEVKREQVSHETWPMNDAIKLQSLTLSDMDLTIRSSDSDLHAGMKLVNATAEFSTQNSEMLSGEASLTYYRYIDERFEGGNVETNTYIIDLANSTILRVEHWQGSGRSIIVAEDELSGTAINAPLEQYLGQSYQLANCNAGAILLTTAYYSGSFMNLTVRDANTSGLLYSENLTEWPANNRFEDRGCTIKQE